MKKIVAFLVLLGVLLISYVLYRDYNDKAVDKVNRINFGDDIILDTIYIYGNHLNIEGNINNTSIKGIELFVKSKEEYTIPLILKNDNEKILFTLSNEINNGLQLDTYTNPIYLFYVKVTDINDKIIYHPIKIKDDLDYYTVTDDNNSNYKIIIDSNRFKTLTFTSKKTDEEVYDIIIDPGHGGTDSGACLYRNSVCERDYTSKISKKIKEKLEQYGLKVTYTWDIDKITNKDGIPNYGENSRTGRSYEAHAKFLFSIHLNSSASRKGSGFEIYTPYNVDYVFANILKENLSKVYKYSSNTENRVSNGIYTRTFTTYDLKDIEKERKEKNYEPLDVSTKTNYYFMIRETGGKLTGAYVDGTNENNWVNPYKDSLIGSEAYIIELAYISNSKDVKHVDENIDLYVDQVVNSIIKYLGKEKSAN